MKRLEYKMDGENSFNQTSFCNYSLPSVRCKNFLIIFEVDLTLNCSQIKVKGAKSDFKNFEMTGNGY